MTIEERLDAVERELAHQNEMRGLREMNDKLAASQVERVQAQFAETRKALPRLEASMKELEDAAIVRNAQTLRHETRVQEHQQWLEEMELAFAKMAAQHIEFDQKMTQLAAAQLLTEEKLQGLIDALRRGGNGHQ